MENQPIITPSDISSSTSVQANQSSIPLPSQTKTNLMMPVLITLLMSAILFGFGGYYLGKKSITTPVEYQISNTQPTAAIQASPTVIPTVQSPQNNETADWRAYSSTVLSFKYPQSLTLEERQKDFIVLLSDSNNPQSVLVSIDARQMENYVNYEKAVLSTKAGLTNVQTEDISNGTKISGKVGPGYGEGQQISIALFKHGTAAVEAETTTTDTSQLQLFNQILSTFKFTN